MERVVRPYFILQYSSRDATALLLQAGRLSEKPA